MNDPDILAAAESLFSLTHSTWQHKAGMMPAAFKIGVNRDNVQPAIALLKKYDCIETDENITKLKDTPTGTLLKAQKKTFEKHYNEVNDDEKRSKEDKEKDRTHKDLQIADLEFRLKTVEDMQERQKRFWSKQNISIMIALGAFGAAIISILISLLLPK